MKIKGSSLLIEIAELYPEVAKKLEDEYGLHCMGCPIAYSETLGGGLEVHGYIGKEKASIIKELNSMISK